MKDCISWSSLIMTSFYSHSWKSFTQSIRLLTAVEILLFLRNIVDIGRCVAVLRCLVCNEEVFSMLREYERRYKEVDAKRRV